MANLLQRHFDCLSNTLWFEEIPNARDPQRSLFFIGGKDSIVDAEVNFLFCSIGTRTKYFFQRVKRYLTSHGVKQGLIFNPEGRHGEALLVGGSCMTKVIQWLKEPLNNIPKTKATTST